MAVRSLHPLVAALTDQWVDGRQTLADVTAAIRSEECHAVFIVAESGLGATTLLTQLDRELRADVAIMPVHGSPSLSNVPYGVLAPYLDGISIDDVTSPVAVLRTLWANTEHRRRHMERFVVLLVDDAHALDEASAAVITELVQAGWAKMVAACKPRPGIPAAMLQLWHDGAAERFDLSALSRHQGHELCVALLGGSVLPSTSLQLWTEAKGNPLLLKTLVNEAKGAGTLVERRGVWLITGTPAVRSLELADVVRRQLLRITPAGREALNLVALSEPVSRSLVEDLCGELAVRELLDHQLLDGSGTGASELRLKNPIYGEVLRSIVPAGRSLMLRQRLLSRMDLQPEGADSLLRMVSWSLDCGVSVPDEQLLRAAVLACKLFQSRLALRISAAVRGPEFRAMANAVAARAHYNQGDYEQAAALLEGVPGRAGDLAQLMTGSLLLAATRLAQGLPAAEVTEEARQLRRAGEQLAQQNPRDAEAIMRSTGGRAMLLDLLAMSAEGDYRLMDPVLADLRQLKVDPSGRLEQELEAVFARAVQAEQECATGCPDLGMATGLQALSAVPPEADDVFFLPEFVLVRIVACSLFAGEWEGAEALLDRYTTSSNPGLVSFSGGSHVAHGFIAIRRGRMATALEDLLPGLEALRVSDPQQLFALCAAMGFYAAVSVGDAEEAERLLSDYSGRRGEGMYLMAATAESFIGAGLELLHGDGGGLERLYRAADDAASRGALSLELHALQLGLAVGDRSRLARFRDVAALATGRWAAALAALGRALDSGHAPTCLSAADTLRGDGLVPLAAVAYSEALRLAQQPGAADQQAAKTAQERLELCRAGMGTNGSQERTETKSQLLTQRERDIVTLAAAGLSDRQIAERLNISVRTVEGHLYRCYAKLGVGGRDQLGNVSSL